MNMIQIEKMCKNIYADYVGMGRKKDANDETILSLIIRQYAQTGIDWEEVKFLWMRFLGNRQIMMRSDIKLPQPFASWSNSL